MFDKGFFGGLFDLNGDGKLDSFEQAADFAFFASLMDEDVLNSASEKAALDEDDLNLDFEEEEQ